MPTTIQQLFTRFNIQNYSSKAWGERFVDHHEGVYIVSTSNSVSENLGTTPVPIFNDRSFREWLVNCPELTVDNVRPTIEVLKCRLSEFWLPDECILYIGKANKRKGDKGLSCRICEFYNPRMGNNSHSGGLWIRTLANLHNTRIYYCYSDKAKELEKDMLAYFMQNVSNSTLAQLRDPKLPLPFANLRFRPKVDKNHGIANQR
jgi:hypothetical protein